MYWLPCAKKVWGTEEGACALKKMAYVLVKLAAVYCFCIKSIEVASPLYSEYVSQTVAIRYPPWACKNFFQIYQHWFSLLSLRNYSSLHAVKAVSILFTLLFPLYLSSVWFKLYHMYKSMEQCNCGQWFWKPRECFTGRWKEWNYVTWFLIRIYCFFCWPVPWPFLLICRQMLVQWMLMLQTTNEW